MSTIRPASASRCPRAGRGRSENGQIDYTPDGGEHFLRIAIDERPDFDDPYLHQLDLEQQLKRLRDYETVSLESNIYRDRKGSLWEFTWTALAKDTPFPGPRRAIEQAYLGRDGAEYVIYMSAPGGGLGDRTRAVRRRCCEGWRPNSG